MIFEVQSRNNLSLEIDDMLDIIDLIKVDGKKILIDGKIGGEYETSERAEEIFKEICDTFEKGVEDFYKLPKK